MKDTQVVDVIKMQKPALRSVEDGDTAVHALPSAPQCICPLLFYTAQVMASVLSCIIMSPEGHEHEWKTMRIFNKKWMKYKL